MRKIGKNDSEILSKDISIIFQGAISKEITARSLKQLRAVFPDAEIILSTWAGTDVTGLQYDKVVFSEDPGPQTGDEIANIPNNVNRQIISTRAGIAQASGKYILKTRTDILINDSGFIDFFGRYDDVPPRFFKNRMLICDFYTRSPRVSKVCYHPSDWILFGNAEDVRKYYDEIDLQSDEDADWFKHHPKKETVYIHFLCRYTPEQHIFLSFLRKHISVDCDYHCQYSKEQMIQTERLFAECFVVLDYQKQMDITFTKYNPNRAKEKNTLLRHKQWKAVYYHYCKHQNSLGWGCFVFNAAFNEALLFMRRSIVRVLVFLNIKEPLKKFFGLFGYGK